MWEVAGDIELTQELVDGREEAEAYEGERPEAGREEDEEEAFQEGRRGGQGVWGGRVEELDYELAEAAHSSSLG